MSDIYLMSVFQSGGAGSIGGFVSQAVKVTEGKAVFSGESRVGPVFTGKELDEFSGLNYFGARRYDPDVAMWMSVDPMRQFWSPYSYTGNGFNPINVVDPDGRQVDDVYHIGMSFSHSAEPMLYTSGGVGIAFRFYPEFQLAILFTGTAGLGMGYHRSVNFDAGGSADFESVYDYEGVSTNAGVDVRVIEDYMVGYEWSKGEAGVLHNVSIGKGDGVAAHGATWGSCTWSNIFSYRSCSYF
jgi:RHS repeat-associated protein